MAEQWPWLPVVSQEMGITLLRGRDCLVRDVLGDLLRSLFSSRDLEGTDVLLHTPIYLPLFAQARGTVETNCSLFLFFFSPPILSDLLPSSTLTLLSFPTPSTAFHSALPFTQSSPTLIHATQAVSSAGPDKVLHVTSETYSSSGKYDPRRVTKSTRVSCLTKLSVPK